MRRAITVLLVGLLLGAFAVGASAFEDKLNGSALGTVNGVVFGPGFEGQAAVFDGHADNIAYDTGTISAEGTFAFFVKGSYVSGQNLLMNTKETTLQAGDIQIGLMPGNYLRFEMFDGTSFNRMVSTSAISANDWTYVAFSYGSEGMKCYVNGSGPQGAFTTGTDYTGSAYVNHEVFLGAEPGTSKGFTGSIDWFRTSATQSDGDLICAPAVPEPASLLALMSALPGIALFRRRRG